MPAGHRARAAALGVALFALAPAPAPTSAPPEPVGVAPGLTRLVTDAPCTLTGRPITFRGQEVARVPRSGRSVSATANGAEVTVRHHAGGTVTVSVVAPGEARPAGEVRGRRLDCLVPRSPTAKARFDGDPGTEPGPPVAPLLVAAGVAFGALRVRDARARRRPPPV